MPEYATGPKSRTFLGQPVTVASFQWKFEKNASELLRQWDIHKSKSPWFKIEFGDDDDMREYSITLGSPGKGTINNRKEGTRTIEFYSRTPDVQLPLSVTLHFEGIGQEALSGSFTRSDIKKYYFCFDGWINVDKVPLDLEKASITVIMLFPKEVSGVEYQCSKALASEFEPISDFLIICEGQEFKCHKLVLAMASEYFCLMFSHPEVVENVNNEMKIVDLDKETVELILKIIYSGELDEKITEEEGMSIIKATDRFQMTEIKESCEKKMIKMLNRQNCIKFLHLGARYNSNSLVEAAMSQVYSMLYESGFMFRRVLASEEFANLVQEHPWIFKEKDLYPYQ